MRRNLHGANLVVIHGPIATSAALIGRHCESLKTPYVLYLHGMLDRFFFDRSAVDRLKYTAYWNAAMRRLLEKAAVVVLTSEQELQRLEPCVASSRSNFRILPYGAEVPTPKRIRRTEGHVSFVSMSRIDPKKNLELMIHALAKSGVNPAHVTLKIHGRPTSQSSGLQQLAAQSPYANAIEFGGEIGGDDKDQALRDADFLVLPSHQENYAVAVAEAMAVGTPVLVSDQVGLAAVVAEHGAGMVLPLEQSAWSTAIAASSRLSLEEYSAMSAAALRAANTHCSATRTTEAFEELYNDLVETAPK